MMDDEGLSSTTIPGISNRRAASTSGMHRLHHKLFSGDLSELHVPHSCMEEVILAIDAHDTIFQVHLPLPS